MHRALTSKRRRGGGVKICQSTDYGSGLWVSNLFSSGMDFGTCFFWDVVRPPSKEVMISCVSLRCDESLIQQLETSSTSSRLLFDLHNWSGELLILWLPWWYSALSAGRDLKKITWQSLTRVPTWHLVTGNNRPVVLKQMEKQRWTGEGIMWGAVARSGPSLRCLRTATLCLATSV